MPLRLSENLSSMFADQIFNREIALILHHRRRDGNDGLVMSSKRYR